MPNEQDARARYLTHQNGIQYDGYVRFLSRAITPALEFLRHDMRGLDYGCGPAPTLSVLLSRQGYRCEDYDPVFVRHALDTPFDFIFSTEVFEHFCRPGEEIKKIRSLMNPDGLLIVMTERWQRLDHFVRWYYTRDPTHVAFYHTKTFDYLCKDFGFTTVFDDDHRVVILKAV